jgi:uncharacterized protein YndB with AHSA1/START domain
MSSRSVAHATFTIERTFDATPARVFAAFASAEAKAKWMFCHSEWETREFEIDFRVGGREYLRTGPKGGEAHIMSGVYHDIVPDERVVISFSMHLDETMISVSLVTIEFKAEGSGTRLLFTEQGAFLDGYDDIAGREGGTGTALDNLEEHLRQNRAAA